MLIPLNYSRILWKNEARAYKNLSDYDEGKFLVRNAEKITMISSEKCDFSAKFEPSELETSIIEVEYNSQYGSHLNKKFSLKKPGEFIDKSSYLATFSKKPYYFSEIDYYVNLFISHNHVHAFYDGNKRTALNLFIDMLSFYTEFYLDDIVLIQNAQILYIEKKIEKEQFKNIIYTSLRMGYMIS